MYNCMDWCALELSTKATANPPPHPHPAINDSQYYDTARVIHHGRESGCDLNLVCLFVYNDYLPFDALIYTVH